ncbi:glycosyltransferase family 2 protein [Bradyrhizobium sp. AUGA SZCCT0431]|uniref:glycosyltransferase family 2 protein n=1 Tax=Bradyrhizobium sp. AUGA SZCCT0431 TaxID=2807674 RepID=UPI001BAE31C0|nr:glycosyltransferase family 2 protein [Bradyrhizobium sp. AUGA SZCCT0431]MBR1142353.1 glycosyltransferase family 2 protein [Bradyrhizobium sp. AUGA SZCCT0431]
MDHNAPKTIATYPAVSVVCPLFNEEAIIERAVQRMLMNLRQQFGDAFELILVNDGSKDKSLERLFGVLVAERAEKQVRVLSYPINQGRGRAIKIGIDEATAPIIVTTEADCSWGDDIVQRLHAELVAHPEADFVIASPHREGGSLVNVSPTRVFLTQAGNRLIRLFFDSSVTMNTGMTRGYRAAVIQPLLTEENGKEFHLEVLLKLLGLGFRAREIPATLTWLDDKLQRDGAAKRKSSTKIFKTITSHLRFIAIAQPVRHFAFLTALIALLGCGFIAAAVAMLVTHAAPAIYLALVGLILFVIALLFAGFSILFFQLRELARTNWMQGYGARTPPTAKPAELVFPVKAS